MQHASTGTVVKAMNVKYRKRRFFGGGRGVLYSFKTAFQKNDTKLTRPIRAIFGSSLFEFYLRTKLSSNLESKISATNHFGRSKFGHI